MQVDLLNGMAFANGTFNDQGGTDKQKGDLKLQEDIKLLITQEKGKFYPDPEFGSEIQKYLFEPMTPTLGRRIQSELKDLINKYYPQITVVSIDVEMDGNNNFIYITINYKYTDSAQELSRIRLELFNKVN